MPMPDLTPEQDRRRRDFAALAGSAILPHADRFDREERVPDETIRQLAEAGWLAAAVPAEYGGGLDMVSFGLMCEAIGGASGSVLSLLIVHGMVCQVLAKWGTPEQRRAWLPRLARGEVLGAFGLTEPLIGSDAKSISTSAEDTGDAYLLTGAKKWISFGQRADLFLIIARCEGQPTAFLVERASPGFAVEPITGMLGFRAAMLGALRLDRVRVPKDCLVGRIGFGFSHVAATALDHGRFCIAWGCVGLAGACLEASLAYSAERQQFGQPLKDHQLIQRMLAGMITSVKAARLLCLHAAHLRDAGDPASIMEISIAKYFASQVASRVSSDAVQSHGANGCSGDYPVQRHFRDARIMEIIEGSNEIQQLIIAKYGHLNFAMGAHNDGR